MYKIIDNYFVEIEKIRNYALSNNFNKNPDKYHGWRGFRTSLLDSQLNSINELINQKILNDVCNFYQLDKDKYLILSYFHYSLESTKIECVFNFESYKWHVDPYKYAGVVYLTPNAPKNCGTTLIKNSSDIGSSFVVENIYNRIFFYPSNLLHAPTNLFGNDINDSRMTISFFIGDSKNI